MTRLAIIADDLTGALDSAAPFAMRGEGTMVAVTPNALKEVLATGASVVGVSTNSRELSPEAARARVCEAIAELPDGIAIFKKVDSRLKGNISAELDAIAYRHALVAPAIPSFGRIVRDGMVEGFGVSEPIDIAGRLGAHAARASIPDTLSQTELDETLALDRDLLVGARGLAEALAREIAPDGETPSMDLAGRRVMCVIGSTDPITIAQLVRLRETDLTVAYVPAPSGIAPPDLPPQARVTILQAVPGASPIDAFEVSQQLATSLSRFQPDSDTLLVISGGATAQVVLEQLGLVSLQIVGEALSGLPIARAGGFTLVTKSGGFGVPDTLVQLLSRDVSMTGKSVGS
ncbi:four-carbon acid sugar kinase family protein [Allomesorhizobium camelthorni]|uniref:Four-carbon acid sugar kinase family protein n=1 Tax=Allomesorhizobium camelthorni TaxID=475069 RepID=A0A6G4WKF5_9HYPH|nr:four-carbon acid sugar kinase family protein [Mesorhizobium camelthorni]NGO55104.1 four-carbon acid sugar kinase family protein [Mesorhizobium camelthorni]